MARRRGRATTISAVLLCARAVVATDTHTSDSMPFRLEPKPLECVWPSCATTCPRCTRKSPTSAQCVVNMPFWRECDVGFECWLGTCVCYPDTCIQADGLCHRRTCTDGARPDEFKLLPGTDGNRLSSFAPPVPLGQGSLHWLGYFTGIGVVVPAIFLGSAFFLAVQIGKFLHSPPDMWICRRRARIPFWLPIWAALTLYFCGSGFMVSEQAMRHLRDAANLSLEAVTADLEKVIELGDSLKTECIAFNSFIQEVPNSCMLQNLTKGRVEGLLMKVNEAATTIYHDVDRLNVALSVLPGKLSTASIGATALGTFLVIIPVVPMAMVLVATIASIFIACLAFRTTRGDVVERAIIALQKHGPGCSGFLIMITALWAALSLHVGLSASAFCFNLDENMVGLAEHMSLPSGTNTTQTHDDVVGAARFYVMGTGYNPLEEIVANIQDGVGTLDDVRNSTKWFETLLAQVCPSMNNFEVSKEREVSYSTCLQMQDLLHPRNIWPHYNNLFHDVLCDKLPQHMSRCVTFSLITGFIMVPVLVLMFYVDLKRMLLDKVLPESEESDEYQTEPDDEEQFLNEKPLLSSATYSHAVSTSVPGHKAGHKRTFLA